MLKKIMNYYDKNINKFVIKNYNKFLVADYFIYDITNSMYSSLPIANMNPLKIFKSTRDNSKNHNYFLKKSQEKIKLYENVIVTNINKKEKKQFMLGFKR